jgi:hypothetical protein
MEQEGKYLGTYNKFKGKHANWLVNHWESVYVIVKFFETGVLLLVTIYLITHW